MTSSRSAHLLSFAVAGLAAALGAQSTPGNLVVVRVGDGSAALTSASTAAFLDEFDRVTPAQPLPGFTTALPVATIGANLPVTLAGTATSEGFLTQSTDGKYLLVTGYGVAPGLAAVGGTTSAAANRVIARIDLSGNLDSSTALTDAHNAGSIRSAVSVDGTSFWTTGAGNGTGGTPRGMAYVAALGATTSVQVPASMNNGRVAAIFDGQLYVSSASAGFIGVNAVGTGLPTTSGQTAALLTGFPSLPATPSPYDFYFADAQTLYVTDDRTNGNGGIQKWTESAGTWTLQYTLAPATNVGCRGLSGITDLTGTTLYATTTQSSANTLVSVLDLGAQPLSTFTVLATAPANTAFRGVRFVRTPYDISFGGTSCPTSVGIPTIGTTGGAPVSGNASFAITVGNAPDVVGPGVGVTFWAMAVGINSSLFPVGVPLPDAPACALLFAFPDILMTGLTDVTGSAIVPLSLAPADASLWGLPVPVQNFVFDFTGFYAGLGLPVGSSVGMQLILGN